MPALALSVIGFIQLAIASAPDVEEIYVNGKKLISDLFEHGLITVEQQNKLMAWADAHQAATLAGELPPELDLANL